MEGSPAALTPDDAAGQILLDGLSDWVDLGMARQYVEDAHPRMTRVDLRRLTMDVVGWMLEHELVQVGDVWKGFTSWSSTTAASIVRIEREWTDPEHALRPGDVCWLCNTAAGDEVGRRLVAEQRVRRE